MHACLEKSGCRQDRAESGAIRKSRARAGSALTLRTWTSRRTPAKCASSRLVSAGPTACLRARLGTRPIQSGAQRAPRKGEDAQLLMTLCLVTQRPRVLTKENQRQKQRAQRRQRARHGFQKLIAES